MSKIYYDFIINKKPITERIKSYEIHGLSKKHLYTNKILKPVKTYLFLFEVIPK